MCTYIFNLPKDSSNDIILQNEGNYLFVCQIYNPVVKTLVGIDKQKAEQPYVLEKKMTPIL